MQSIACHVCPHVRVLNPGEYGRCKQRVAQIGRVASSNYGQVTCLECGLLWIDRSGQAVSVPGVIAGHCRRCGRVAVLEGLGA